MNDRADWQEQREQERERWELSMEALARAQELGLEEMYLKHFARECGVSNYQTRKVSHAAHE
ncbi:MAG TPA: hypothetical protein VFA81_10850 [Burkholderiales bacterium]|nr:hypothetical protein [Burkholderiales bacterium]